MIVEAAAGGTQTTTPNDEGIETNKKPEHYSSSILLHSTTAVHPTVPTMLIIKLTGSIWLAAPYSRENLIVVREEVGFLGWNTFGSPQLCVANF